MKALENVFGPMTLERDLSNKQSYTPRLSAKSTTPFKLETEAPFVEAKHLHSVLPVGTPRFQSPKPC